MKTSVVFVYLEGLEVVGDDPELLLQLHDLGLAGLSALLRVVQVALALLQLLRHLVVLPVSLLGLVPARVTQRLSLYRV